MGMKSIRLNRCVLLPVSIRSWIVRLVWGAQTAPGLRAVLMGGLLGLSLVSAGCVGASAAVSREMSLSVTATATPGADATSSPIALPEWGETPVPATGDLAAAQAALAGYEPVADVRPTVNILLEHIARWLGAGGAPAELEVALDQVSEPDQSPVTVEAWDVTGDGDEDVVLQVPVMGLPLLVFVNERGAFKGYTLPRDYAETLAASWSVEPGLTVWGEAQPPLELVDLTGDGVAEILLTYMFPGGSGFHLQPIVFQWHDGGFRPIFAAHLVNWAGEAGLVLGPDPTGAGRRQIVLRYPYLFGEGFDHKMVNHPLGWQIWRWSEEAGRFVRAADGVDLERSGWGPDAPVTPGDQLRWFANEGEQKFRRGNYDEAVPWYNRTLTLAAEEEWAPGPDDPDWRGFAAFRRAETLLLRGAPDRDPLPGYDPDGLTAMRAVAGGYQGDMLGELAWAFLEGYGDGLAVDAAARGVAAMQGVDLYTYFYYEGGDNPGALRFPMDAAGILFPGAGLAAYLNARPGLAGERDELRAGLAEAGFAAEHVEWLEQGQIQIGLRLPDTPNAEGRLALWTLADGPSGWHVVRHDTQPYQDFGSLLLDRSADWPVVGDFQIALPEDVRIDVEPPEAEPGQSISVRVSGLPSDVVAGRTMVCLSLEDETGQNRDGLLPISPGAGGAAAAQFTLSRGLEPGGYRLNVITCGWTDPDVDPEHGESLPYPETLASVPYTILEPTGQFDRVQRLPSPDGRWTAIVNQTRGSLELRLEPEGETALVFPEGSTVESATWSPNGCRLLVVRTNYCSADCQSALQTTGPIEIWGIELRDEQVGQPVRLFRAPAEEPGPEGIVFGHWSPDSRYVIFWLGGVGASIQADGLPLYVLDVEAYQAIPSKTTTLLNPRYQSWSPDSSTLAFTAGGYRSAQINKWLNLLDVASEQVTMVISETRQVPGIVAWSPRGDLIAYAAVPADQTGTEWADWMVFENQAIAGRRVYLLDPATLEHRPVNQADVFQDAPVWSEDGKILYYVQRDGDTMVLMAADPYTGEADPIEESRRPAPRAVGYYGQSDWSDLLAYRPGAPRAEVPPLAETYIDLEGRFTLRYPEGWQVGQGWQSIYGWQDMPVLSSYPLDGPEPELGPFGGQALIAIQTRQVPEAGMEALLEAVLAAPGPGQILSQGESLVSFDRRELTVEGRAATRLETIGEFGTANHVLIALDGERALVLRGQGDRRIFDAIIESLRFPEGAVASGSDDHALESAREALIAFFSLLHDGHYDEAVAYYGGSYRGLRDWNPLVAPDDHATLLQ